MKISYLFVLLFLASQSVFASECFHFQQKIKKYNLKELTFPISLVPNIPQTARCLKQSNVMKSVHLHFENTCGKLDPSQLSGISAGDWVKKVQPCIQAVYAYQAQLTDQSSSVADLKKELFGILNEGRFRGQLDTKRLYSISKNISILAPEDGEAAKLVSIVMTMALLSDKSSKDDRDRWKAVESSLIFAEKLNPKDPAVLELRLVIKSNGLTDLNALSSELSHLSKENKELVSYFNAYIAWKKGNISRTKMLLESAIALHPKDHRFKQTLETIKNAVDLNKVQPFRVDLTAYLNEEV
ncbi:MAG: hypothetical protein CL678_07665 [Bdellovibrionaceae bacterium]|nr:hypothetical protein [Pseudobdellovibrionaceae bacterium]|tara:strand:- start:493 stop:1386 length:894 start_codon:yes stop_codon:yes gene_type:complete